MKYKYRCSENSRSDIEMCEECFQKQLKIDRQAVEIEQLKNQLRYRKKNQNEPYGSSTPSSKIAFKENSLRSKENAENGRPTGHSDNGRTRFSEAEAEETISLKVEIQACPECGGRLESEGVDSRAFLDAAIIEAKKVIYKCQVKSCTKCKKKVTRKPIALPGKIYSNNLIANAMVMHYLEGIPLNTVARLMGNGVSGSALIRIFHELGESWKDAYENLKKEYREEPVKHADETGWRTKGNNGYAWLFCSPTISLFSFEKTRSGEIPKSILGDVSLPGVLIVDRYAGYNQVPCHIQYCYAHLLRDVTDLEKKFPKIKEVQLFVADFAPLLTAAMKLRRQDISNEEYIRAARVLKEKILGLARSPAKHAAIQTYQSIFIEKESRLFHWVQDRAVPCENNRAERELRPTVIARKVSFGSQSTKGALTRSILMSILHSAAKRAQKITIKQWILSSIDNLAQDSPLSFANL